ncbi:MAG: excinuclease ABC subunit UvrC [Bacilli bacterium]|nr:excinuclease ABC subunit UvrC [Bacilli bacterium]
MNKEHLKSKLEQVPESPGSYQMKNKDGIIIYVGKAKNLHRRVNSYFNRTQTGKTAKLVSEIEDFTYIVTSTELEAFLLEINLIKEYDPKYNILLKDDKSYPYIEYVSKPYPKLKVSRYLKVKKSDHKKLFGPYPNAYAARRIVNLLNRLYPLKKCEGNPKKVCLYYHIGECLGYCEKKVDPVKLMEMEKSILGFLNGNDQILIDKITSKMEEYSKALNFELALELKKELDYIHIVLSRQKITIQDYTNRDVIGYFFDQGYIAVQFLFLRNGKIVGGHSDIFPVVSSLEEDMENYITKFYLKHEIPKEILMPGELITEVLDEYFEHKLIVPLKGQKKKILEMAMENAKICHDNEFEITKKKEESTLEANEELRELLHMDILDRIDLFDNSNLFGSWSVSGMVVFKNGVPAKNEYRKYKIEYDKNDDYDMMREVIYRRYQRALVEKTELPNLIIVDGGIGQIHACKEILGELNLPVKVCGLKKNDKHRTNDLVDGDTLELIEIPKDSKVFHYFTRMQDEVHRFMINYHRSIRSKGSIASVLDDIPGIGEKRKKELIKKFGSVAKMESASVEELSSILPFEVASSLKRYLEERKIDKQV